MTLTFAMLVDILVVVYSLWFLLRTTDRSIFNPAFWYLALHAYVVTFRLVMCANGAPTDPVIGVRSDSEIVKAALVSDLGLIAAVVASLFSTARSAGQNGSSPMRYKPARLNPQIGQVIAALCVFGGTYALIMFGSMAQLLKARGSIGSGLNIGEFDTTSYPIMLESAAVQGPIILCAMQGFVRWRVALLGAMLALTAVNLSRVNFVVPAILTLLVYFSARRRNRLSWRWAIALASLGVLWFVFKPIAHAIQDGTGLEGALESAHYYAQDVAESGGGDTQFLDMEASMVAASDEKGMRFYGATYLPLVYLPIPRFMWPDKPRLNEFMKELSSPSRPFVYVGMVPNLAGESYLNFGWIGAAAIPFLYMYIMQSAYRSVRHHGVDSAGRLVYLVFLVDTIIVFRDGLLWTVLFPLITALPLFGWAAISWILPAFGSRGDIIAARRAVLMTSRRLAR